MIRFIYRAIAHVRKKMDILYFCKKTHSTNKPVNIGKNVEIVNINIKIGNNVHIYKDVSFFGDGPIIIGNNVDIGNQTIIYSSKEGGVYIGDNVNIAAQCYIIDTDHGIEKGRLINEQKCVSSKVVIEDDVWIAAGCKILRGSIIKKGAVVGAQSVCKGTVDEYSVVAGVPAKRIKFRM